jgi:urease subunit alpha
MQRPRAGAVGKAKNALSLAFVSQAGFENEVGEEYGLTKEVVPIKGTRNLAKDSMVRNDYCPEGVAVDSETFEVTIDGEVVTCDPAEEISLAQRYTL